MFQPCLISSGKDKSPKAACLPQLLDKAELHAWDMLDYFGKPYNGQTLWLSLSQQQQS